MNLLSKITSELIVVFIVNAKNDPLFYVIDKQKNDVLEFSTLKELISFYGKKNAYWFHIIGSGTLTRNIENQYGYLETVTANGNTADFYFSSYKINDNVIVSFVRKAIIESQVESINMLEIQLLNISIGVIPLFIKNDLNFDFEYKILIEENQLLNFDKNDDFIYETYLAVNKKQLLIFEESIRTFFNNENESLEFAIENEIYLKNKLEFKAKNRFTKIGIGFLFIMLILIFGNHFYSNKLKSEIGTKEINIEIINNKIKTIENLKIERTRKVELLKSAGINYSNYFSFYINEILLSTPSNVKLNSFNLFPVKSELKNDVKIEFANQLISMNGSVAQSDILDGWIKKLKSLDWIIKIQVVNFIKLDSTNNNFTILLTIKK